MKQEITIRSVILMVAMLAMGLGHARASTETLQGFCTVGGVRVQTQGIQSSNPVQASFPRCLVTVYVTNSTIPATIYANGNQDHLANPFTANADGSWRFWADNSVGYDIVLQGGVPPFPVPFILTNVKAGGVTGSAIPIPLNEILDPTNSSAIDLGGFAWQISGSGATPGDVVINNNGGTTYIGGSPSQPTGVVIQSGGMNVFNDNDANDLITVGQHHTVTNWRRLAIESYPSGNSFSFQGYQNGLGFNQALDINPRGGAVTVNASRVCTDAAPCAGTPTSYPAVGLAVSIGSAWGTSIDPATVPRTSTANTFTQLQTFAGISAATALVGNSPVCTEATGCETGPGPTYPPAGIGVSTGTAWSANSINPTTLATWPATGVPVSTGTAWGTSIPAANIPLLNASGNTFTGVLAATQLNLNNPATVSDATLVALQPSLATNASNSLYIGQNLSSFGYAINYGFINYGSVTANRGTIGFVNGAQTVFGNGGDWVFPNNVLVTNQLFTSQLFITNPATVSGIQLLAIQPNITPGNTSNLYVGQSNTIGNVVNYGFNFQGAGSPNNRGTIGFSGGVQTVFDSGGNWTFPNNLLVTGAFAAEVKNFRIRYPGSQAKDNRWLIHSSLEGPEIAVFYRGEAKTHDGKVEIELPSYFESLTRKNNRTVLLTAIADDTDSSIGMLAASHVTAGKFRVRSSGNPEQSFYWEVKAIRSDVPPLEIEERSTPLPPTKPVILKPTGVTNKR